MRRAVAQRGADEAVGLKLGDQAQLAAPQPYEGVAPGDGANHLAPQHVERMAHACMRRFVGDLEVGRPGNRGAERQAYISEERKRAPVCRQQAYDVATVAAAGQPAYPNEQKGGSDGRAQQQEDGRHRVHNEGNRRGSRVAVCCRPSYGSGV